MDEILYCVTAQGYMVNIVKVITITYKKAK